jgi:hypothetical protein
MSHPSVILEGDEEQAASTGRIRQMSGNLGKFMWISLYRALAIIPALIIYWTGNHD